MNEHRHGEALPAIPAKQLKDLRAVASLPTKSLPKPQFMAIWILTERLKSKMTLGAGGATGPWEKLREILEAAALSGDFRAIDEFSKAWKAWGRPGAAVPFIMPGLSFTVNIPGSCSAIPRRKKTLAVLLAIEDIQRRLRSKRAPTHREILDLVGKREGIDDTELSRQLKSLGLQDRINPSRETS